LTDDLRLHRYFLDDCVRPAMSLDQRDATDGEEVA
jgi:hypothetical protein